MILTSKTAKSSRYKLLKIQSGWGIPQTAWDCASSEGHGMSTSMALFIPCKMGHGQCFQAKEDV